MTKIISFPAIMFLLNAALCNAQSAESGFLNRTVSLDGIEYRYQTYVPLNYNSTEKWPVMLFLHGAGERGSDGLKQTQVGLGKAIRLNPERWQSIAVFPQVPAGESWQGIAGDIALAALDATIAEFSVDESRLYLTGISLGGNGTWYLGYQNTERFAALVSICGFIDLGSRFPGFLPEAENSFTALAKSLSKTPVWIVHGDADVVVPVEQSRKIVLALEAVGSDVHYTELQGVNHNAWDTAYANTDLIEWLFNQRR
ncbi:prolyl oligopeptidase family serine peptidase [Gammaproteobacteria bacterium]|nr:prolyl oligopeptidase family serine peptidase [Gammaproteobacteria bacterium]